MYTRPPRFSTDLSVDVLSRSYAYAPPIFSIIVHARFYTSRCAHCRLPNRLHANALAKEPAKWMATNVAAHPPVLNHRSFGSAETATEIGWSRMTAAATAASLWIGRKP